MVAGYLQAAAYTNLNNHRGLQGWRCVFGKKAKQTLLNVNYSPTDGFLSSVLSSRYRSRSCKSELFFKSGKKQATEANTIYQRLLYISRYARSYQIKISQ